MCKHIVYTTIVSFQMNIVHRRKIKNRKKKKNPQFPAVWSHVLKKSLIENVIFCAVKIEVSIKGGTR